jgi:hypothetical protein
MGNARPSILPGMWMSVNRTCIAEALTLRWVYAAARDPTGPGQIGRRQWPIVQQKPRAQVTMGETMTGAYKGDCQTGHMDPSVIKSEPLQS